MFRVKVSRYINYYLFRGRPNEMVSTRVYIEDITWAINIINGIFFLQKSHCREAFYHDYFLRRY